MYYKILITNITSHSFYWENGVLPMHKLVCDTYNELTGESKQQAVLLEPGPEREWDEIQKNGFVTRYQEDILSTETKPGYHYRYIASSTITLEKNRVYSIAIPTPIHHKTPAAAKQDETTFRFLKLNGIVYLCAFGVKEENKVLVLHPELYQSLNKPTILEAYTFEEFKKLPFIEWKKLKEGVDPFWVDADSFEPCNETFNDVFDNLPDLRNVEAFTLADTELVGDEAYRIEEEAD